MYLVMKNGREAGTGALCTVIMNRETVISWDWLSCLLAGEAQVSRPLRRDAGLSAPER